MYGIIHGWTGVGIVGSLVFVGVLLLLTLGHFIHGKRNDSPAGSSVTPSWDRRFGDGDGDGEG